MLYIIGLDHCAQARKPGITPTKAQQAFADCLRRTIAQVRPSLIAEEDSEEALADRHKISIAQEIAGETGIEHRFCDPTRKERKAIGCVDRQALEREMPKDDDEDLSFEETRIKALAIEIGRNSPRRERFWLERLDEFRNHDVVFICGDDHTDSFGRLLDRNGVPFRVVERGIGLKRDNVWLDTKVKQYLNDHPELMNE
jgi:hypothetical protein